MTVASAVLSSADTVLDGIALLFSWVRNLAVFDMDGEHVLGAGVCNCYEPVVDCATVLREFQKLDVP